jgi:dihydrofolate reductase
VRRVVAVEYVSLDGVFEDPQWTFPFGAPEIEQYQYDQLFRSDALLLGRVTYEEFAASWPDMEGTGDFGERINSMPKHVATTTQDQLDWNATPIKGDVATAVAELKQDDGGDLLIYGSAKLVDTLMAANLIDEYRLITYPVVLGEGERLLQDSSGAPALKLAEAKVFDTGVVSLVYEPAETTELSEPPD